MGFGDIGTVTTFSPTIAFCACSWHLIGRRGARVETVVSEESREMLGIMPLLVSLQPRCPYPDTST